jgi:hypothetical protein
MILSQVNRRNILASMNQCRVKGHDVKVKKQNISFDKSPQQQQSVNHSYSNLLYESSVDTRLTEI